ncbi:MAG: preprotein translocase subunit SecE [Firmicutes bacterium]|nr:preprotein translocase subunit SecE [Bacillota bacterium]
MATESGAENVKRPNIIFRIGRWFKSAAMELRKTTWPEPKAVLKKLGIVLMVVAMFFVVLMAMDLLLQNAFYKPLTTGIREPVTPTELFGR